MTWMVIHFSDKPGIVMGPFEDAFTAIALISEDFDYEATSCHATLEEALADRGTTMSFRTAGQ